MPGLLFKKQEESVFLLSTISQIIMGFSFAIECHVLLGREILVMCMQTPEMPGAPPHNSPNGHTHPTLALATSVPRYRG